MQPEKISLILVDGSSYLFRAYHALPPLMNSKGEPSGAIYGVMNMLKNLLKKYSPDHVAIIFDTKSKNFRHHLYPAYKANRPEMPQELALQIQPLHDMIRASGLPLIAVQGVEADDVIGTLAKRFEAQGLHVLISTGDKDMAQLVSDHISLINTMNDSYMDATGVVEKFGVPPALIIDYLTLVGDTSDNIPGVPQVGTKTAVKLLNEFGSLEAIIKHADQVKGKLGETLRATIPQLPLTKTLVTIKHDIPLDYKLEDLAIKAIDSETLSTLFSRYNFKKWLAELSQIPAQSTAKKKYETISTVDALSTWIDKLKQAEYFSFDTETTSLDYMQAKIVGVSFSIEQGAAAYVPLAHDYIGVSQQLDKETVLNALKPLLESTQPKIIGQNLKYDTEVLANENIQLNAVAFDTMLESYVLDSQGSRHDMESLALKYLNRPTISYAEVAGNGAKQIPFSQVDIEKATEYAAEDADVTLCLHQALWPQLEKDVPLKHVFSEIEMPLIPILAKIERTGVLIDVNLLNEQSKELEKRLAEIEREVYQLSGFEFNLNSPKQLQDVLYEKLKLPVLKKTPTGQPSTAEPVLQELAFDYPIPKMILEYRSLSKLKSTYTDALPRQIDADTGRVHTSYHQAGTGTGRLSSSDPNLQNIPVRTEEGRRIRKAFIAPPGFKILAADYSQIELRLMAHLSQDKNLLNAFAKGLDVHKATAAEVFSVSVDAVTSEQRRHAKAINFGLIYGMSSFGLAKQLGIERDAAQRYIDLYFDRYPGVKQYMDDTCKKARQQGFVETLFGRRLYLPDIHSKNIQIQRGAERAAINAPLQGTAADIIKIAMIKLQQWLSENNVDARMIMQVHDELVLEAKEGCVNRLKQEVPKIMSAAAALSVELVVDVGIGHNWDEAH